MTLLAKTLLVVGITGITAGAIIDCCGMFGLPELSAMLPLGTVALGAFFIMFILRNEMAKYDEEQRSKMQSFQKVTECKASSQAPSGPVITQLKEKIV
jgi:hypothetical protein